MGATVALLNIFMVRPFFPTVWAILVNFRSQKYLSSRVSNESWQFLYCKYSN